MENKLIEWYVQWLKKLGTNLEMIKRKVLIVRDNGNKHQYNAMVKALKKIYIEYTTKAVNGEQEYIGKEYQNLYLQYFTK